MDNMIEKLLNEPVIAINIGLQSFAASLEEQEAEVVQVNWTPPAGGDQEMIDILDTLL